MRLGKRPVGQIQIVVLGCVEDMVVMDVKYG
jgi:hypothetical protein